MLRFETYTNDRLAIYGDKDKYGDRLKEFGADGILKCQKLDGI